MTVMITSKTKKLSLVILAISIVSVFAILYLKVNRDWDGNLGSILRGWSYVIHGIPMVGMMLTIIMFSLGKKVAALITSLIYTIFAIASTVNIFKYDDNPQMTVIIIDLLALTITAICLLSIIMKDTDYSASYIFDSKESTLLSLFSGAIIISYYFMNYINQDFSRFIPEITPKNFFAAFTMTKGDLFILHALIAVSIMGILYLGWNKQFKLFFGLDIALSILLLIMIFMHLDTPYRTVFFYIVTLMAIVETVIAIILFLANLKPDLEKKKAELELLRNNGMISEEEYTEKVKEIDGN